MHYHTSVALLAIVFSVGTKVFMVHQIYPD